MINERTGKITRTTRETDIDITVSLDGNGKAGGRSRSIELKIALPTAGECPSITCYIPCGK